MAWHVKWWQPLIGIPLLAFGGYQTVHGLRELQGPPLPECGSAEAISAVRNIWPSTAVPIANITKTHETTATADHRACTALFEQNNSLHDGTIAFDRLPTDHNKFRTSVMIAPLDQLTIGQLELASDTANKWQRWTRVTQTDYGTVTFVANQNQKGGWDTVPYATDGVPKVVSLDLRVEDMPHRKGKLSGAGVFFQYKDKKDAMTFFTISSDGVFSMLDQDDTGFHMQDQFKTSLITSGMNSLAFTQEPEHHVAININGKSIVTLSPVDLSDKTGAFLTTLGDGNRIEMANFQVNKPPEIRDVNNFTWNTMGTDE